MSSSPCLGWALRPIAATSTQSTEGRNIPRSEPTTAKTARAPRSPSENTPAHEIHFIRFYSVLVFKRNNPGRSNLYSRHIKAALPVPLLGPHLRAAGPKPHGRNSARGTDLVEERVPAQLSPSRPGGCWAAPETIPGQEQSFQGPPGCGGPPDPPGTASLGPGPRAAGVRVRKVRGARGTAHSARPSAHLGAITARPFRAGYSCYSPTGEGFLLEKKEKKS